MDRMFYSIFNMHLKGSGMDDSENRNLKLTKHMFDDIMYITVKHGIRPLILKNLYNKCCICILCELY